MHNYQGIYHIWRKEKLWSMKSTCSLQRHKRAALSSLAEHGNMSLLCTRETGECCWIRAWSSQTKDLMKHCCHDPLQSVEQGSGLLDPLLYLNLIVAAFNNWISRPPIKVPLRKEWWDKSQHSELEMGNKQTIFTPEQLDAYQV